MQDEPVDPDGLYECKEDDLVDNFLKLFLSELVLKYAYYLYWNIHLKVKSSVKKDFDWR